LETDEVYTTMQGQPIIKWRCTFRKWRPIRIKRPFIHFSGHQRSGGPDLCSPVI